MVRQIHLKELIPFDMQRMGERPTPADVSKIVDEDCNVYGPEGNLVVAFRKGAFAKVVEDPKDYEYWRWACRSLLSDQRGLAAGKDIYTNVEIRLTHGQNDFLRKALKGQVANLEDALEIVNADPRPSRTTYYVGKVEKAGLVDLEEVEKWDSIVRKKATSFEDRQVAVANRNRAKLTWFENWLRRDWATAEDKIAEAKRAKAHFVTNQPRSNKTYSAVLGIIDRSGRTPFGRLTSPTVEKFEDFARFKTFYKDVDAFVKEFFPKEYKLLKSRFKKVKDERYNLFGTIYTSITCNFNFPTFWHMDGNNARDAVATLVSFDKGSYEGMDFLMPQLGLGFRMRNGDVLAGDNQNLVHGQTEFVPLEDCAEALTLVFYSRESVIALDDLKCETCRRSFLDYVRDNHPERGTGEPKWAGSFPGMWSSPEWLTYRKLQNMEHCSETTIKGSLDTYHAEIN